MGHPASCRRPGAPAPAALPDLPQGLLDDRPPQSAVRVVGWASVRWRSDREPSVRGEPPGHVWSIGVLDPTRLDALLVVVTPLIESQIAQVDEIVITKVDECDEKKITWTRGLWRA